jgi:hypothetical protein
VLVVPLPFVPHLPQTMHPLAPPSRPSGGHRRECGVRLHAPRGVPRRQRQPRPDEAGQGLGGHQVGSPPRCRVQQAAVHHLMVATAHRSLGADSRVPCSYHCVSLLAAWPCVRAVASSFKAAGKSTAAHSLSEAVLPLLPSARTRLLIMLPAPSSPHLRGPLIFALPLRAPAAVCRSSRRASAA